MRLSQGTALILGLVPFALAAVLWRPTSLQRQLCVWLTAGILLGQWMHAMSFVWDHHLRHQLGPAELNVAYFWHVPWWSALLVGCAVSIGLGIALGTWGLGSGSLDPKHLGVTLFLLLAASQLSGSSVPKLAGEMSLAIIFVIGLLVDQYFLTYAVGPRPPAYQVQGDALTSLGLLVTVVAVLWPSYIQFGGFLFEKYFAAESDMRQFQMTRYAAYGGWMLLGVSLIGWKTIDLLISARHGRV